MSSRLDPNGVCCARINGRQADELISAEILRCLSPLGIEAALAALRAQQDNEDDRIKQKSLALEQARYEAVMAQGQYDAVDATNRLVAVELERRWNVAWSRQAAVEEEIRALRQERPQSISAQHQHTLLALGADLRRLGEHPQSSREWKKRILRTVLTGILVTANGSAVQLLLRWRGGDPTLLDYEKVRIVQHRFVTDATTVDLVGGLARLPPDAMIASILNRIGRRTAHGERWTARSVCSLRHRHAIDVHAAGEWRRRAEVTLEEAAAMLRVTPPTVMKWIRSGCLRAALCPSVPGVLQLSDVASLPAILAAAPSSDATDAAQLALNIH